MVADFFAKQGRSFKKFRKIIMNIPDQDEISVNKKKKKRKADNANALIGHRSVLDKKQKQ